METERLCEGVFKGYDNIVLMTGLNVDKKLLNRLIQSTSSGNLGKSLILMSNASDAQVLALFFHKRNYGKCLLPFYKRSSPFCKKNVYHFYGDGPYTFNEFMDSVYIKIPKSGANQLQQYINGLWNSGKWGWELLSHFFDKYMTIQNKSDLSCGIEVKGKDKENREGRLKFLLRMAKPASLGITSKEEGELIISDSQDDIVSDSKSEVVRIPVKRFLPAFNFELIRSQLSDISGKKTAFVTIGGAEHNIYLNLATAERREEDLTDRVLYDYSNVFDMNIVNKSPENKVVLTTHGYVGVRIFDAKRGSFVDIERDGHKTAGIIVKIEHKFGDFYEKKADLFVVFGTGRMGALATKLTFIRMLLEDSHDKLRDNGIYYVMFSESEDRFNIYIKEDPVHKAASIASLLSKEEIRRASSITVVP